MLALVDPCPAERLPAQPRERQEVVAVRRPELPRRVEHEPDRAERLAAVRERQQRRRLRLRADLGEARVAAEDRLRALQPQRRVRACGLGERQVRVERERAEPLHGVVVVPGGVRELEHPAPSSSSAPHALDAPSASAPCAAAVAATSRGVSARARSARRRLEPVQATVQRRALQRVPGDLAERPQQLPLGLEERARVRAAHRHRAQQVRARDHRHGAQRAAQHRREHRIALAISAGESAATVRRSRTASAAGSSASSRRQP